MNLFEQLNPMSEKVGIIVPSTVDVDKEIDNSQYVEATLTKLSYLFGGATAVDQSGGWLSDSKGLVLENSTMVFAYASELPTEKLNEVYIHAEQLAQELNQETIGVEINNKLYFVEQPEEKIMHVG